MQGCIAGALAVTKSAATDQRCQALMAALVAIAGLWAPAEAVNTQVAAVYCLWSLSTPPGVLHVTSDGCRLPEEVAMPQTEGSHVDLQVHALPAFEDDCQKVHAQAACILE